MKNTIFHIDQMDTNYKNSLLETPTNDPMSCSPIVLEDG